jgi:hypothetical protein
MLALSFAAALLLFGGDDPYADRPRHPLAKSLPQLTKEETAKIDAVVDRFIQLEIGKLPKKEEKSAKDDLYRLGPEAIFSLVDGFNRAAMISSSCATVTIGKKIENIVAASSDLDLIAYVRENVGAGVDEATKKKLPLVNSIRNVHTTCLLRKGELLRNAANSAKSPTPGKAISLMSMAELEKAAGKERGEQLKKVLTEIERRQSERTPIILAKVASSGDTDVKKLARGLLVSYAEKQSPTQLKLLLKHDSGEVRAAAVKAVANKNLRWGDELIALLQDDDGGVQQAARGALVQMADGKDFGPAPNASTGDRAAAVQKWRTWWQGQK